MPCSSVSTFDECQDLCSSTANCVSIEWKADTAKCQLSSSCIEQYRSDSTSGWWVYYAPARPGSFDGFPGFATGPIDLYSAETTPCNLEQFLTTLVSGQGYWNPPLQRDVTLTLCYLGYYWDPLNNGAGYCKTIDKDNVTFLLYSSFYLSQCLSQVATVRSLQGTSQWLIAETCSSCMTYIPRNDISGNFCIIPPNFPYLSPAPQAVVVCSPYSNANANLNLNLSLL